ncbi:MAG TPA: outer membrane beta-barrel protein [Vicinamibacterales bacterium]|jgi:opacity protein-like surface antigen
MRITRSTTLPAAILLAIVFSTSAWAQEPHASVQGFGGLGVGGVNSVHPTFGGAIVGDLTPNISLIGEVGRLGDVLPSRTQTLIGLTPVDVSVSAFYGSGGVRLASRPSAVRPYVEASAGIARLTPQVSGLPSGLPGVLTNVGLSLLNRTSPIASLGGGVMLQGGPLFADIGYRYVQVFGDSWMDALALGSSLNTNEVRVGVGVRF